jgi:hypothetical protein
MFVSEEQKRNKYDPPRGRCGLPSFQNQKWGTWRQGQRQSADASPPNLGHFFWKPRGTNTLRAGEEFASSHTCPPGRAPGRSAGRAPGRSAGRAPGRSAGRAPGRSAGTFGRDGVAGGGREERSSPKNRGRMSPCGDDIATTRDTGGRVNPNGDDVCF